jgi:PadR family transcriptional regulator PadR
MTNVRMSPQTALVLEDLLSRAGQVVHGFEVIKATGLPSGTLYPILARLEAAGWLESDWEAQPASGGPRRRFYKLTGDGLSESRLQLAEWRFRANELSKTRFRPGRAVTG